MDGRAPGATLLWVDAFTGTRFSGNPAAVCLLEGAADEEWMQALAAELGISETAYVWPDPTGGFRLRWFTPTTEVDLCGHATLAAAHAMGETGLLCDGQSVAFATRSGTLTARLDHGLVELDLPADPPVAVADPVDWPTLMPGGPPVAAAVRGSRDLVAVVADPAAVRSAVPDLRAVAALPFRALYVTAPGGEEADYVLRVFGPAVGIDEDPVTGSAQCVLGPYWSRRLGRAEGTGLDAVQVSARGGALRVTVAGDRVRVGGRAVTVLAGRVDPDHGPGTAGARW